MKEHPILFSAGMVRALLNGTKTCTRRVIGPQPDASCYNPINTDGNRWEWCADVDSEDLIHYKAKCPHGSPGDKLWVRETYRTLYDPATCLEGARDIDYRADGEDRIMDRIGKGKWKPSIFMPRWASRLTLEVTGVRVERLQEITDGDAKAEGAKLRISGVQDTIRGPEPTESYRTGFVYLWESINGKTHPWVKNPWVWVIEFKRLTPPESNFTDAMIAAGREG